MAKKACKSVSRKKKVGCCRHHCAGKKGKKLSKCMSNCMGGKKKAKKRGKKH